MVQVLLVFTGGGLGSLLRYGIGLIFQKSISSLPIATLSANVLACLIFGFTVYITEQKSEMPPSLKALLLTGFCGGLSTFSTFGFETFTLLKQSEYLWVTVNVVLSLTLCIGSFALFKH